MVISNVAFQQLSSCLTGRSGYQDVVLQTRQLVDEHLARSVRLFVCFAVAAEAGDSFNAARVVARPQRRGLFEVSECVFEPALLECQQAEADWATLRSTLKCQVEPTSPPTTATSASWRGLCGGSFARRNRG